jgi:hypothetical protein
MNAFRAGQEIARIDQKKTARVILAVFDEEHVLLITVLHFVHFLIERFFEFFVVVIDFQTFVF